MKTLEKTEYGYFSEDGREYVLLNPLLERPWMNVLSNGRWCYVASHLGGGYSFLDNPAIGRITRWHIDGVPRDTVGKLVYLRDEESGEWWTANGYPPTRKLDKWECHIGLGYNRIVAKQSGIESEILYFVPMPDPSMHSTTADPCLVWKIRLVNISNRKRIISATSYVELALGNWNEDTKWREFYLGFNRQIYDKGIIYTRSMQWIKYDGGWQATNSQSNNITFDHAVFLASSAEVKGYEGDRYRFIGSYRDLRNPEVMEHGRLGNRVVDGCDACEALQHVFELDPGQNIEYVVILGAIPTGSSDAAGITEKYLTVEKARRAFVQNQKHWDQVTAIPHVRTPDMNLNMLVNQWLKYQSANLSWWTRNTSYYYFGIYNFGIRDACQDAVSHLADNPQWVREHIVKKIMIWQFEQGDWAHGGDFISMQGTRTFHSDDPINPCFIVTLNKPSSW